MKLISFSAFSRLETFWRRVTMRRERLWQSDDFPCDHYEVLIAAAAHIGEGSVLVAHAFERLPPHRS
jgi:hypothetical protein